MGWWLLATLALLGAAAVAVRSVRGLRLDLDNFSDHSAAASEAAAAVSELQAATAALHARTTSAHSSPSAAPPTRA